MGGREVVDYCFSWSTSICIFLSASILCLPASFFAEPTALTLIVGIFQLPLFAGLIAVCNSHLLDSVGVVVVAIHLFSCLVHFLLVFFTLFSASLFKTSNCCIMIASMLHTTRFGHNICLCLYILTSMTFPSCVGNDASCRGLSLSHLPGCLCSFCQVLSTPQKCATCLVLPCDNNSVSIQSQPLIPRIRYLGCHQILAI